MNHKHFFIVYHYLTVNTSSTLKPYVHENFNYFKRTFSIKGAFYKKKKPFFAYRNKEVKDLPFLNCSIIFNFLL